MAPPQSSWPLRVGDARSLAAHLLDGHPDRWRHTVGVAHRAEDLAITIGTDDFVVLLSAAWLHDIGYGDAVRETGFHPLDGARYLDRLGWPRRVVDLVAHHSGARLVAAARGQTDELSAYSQEQTQLSDALTYADQTVGPDGAPLTIEERMADMLERHGPDSPNARAHHRRGPQLLAVAQRVEARLVRVALYSGSSQR